ncbi:MAG: gluconokinase [Saprospiraceae bacterium]|nr:gluconokinase [Saprospiraceae bacterium]
MTAILALDLGTSNLKVAAFDTRGREVAVRSTPTPKVGDGLLDAKTMAIRCEQLIKTLVADLPSGCRIEAVVLSTAMHSIGLFDTGSEALTPLMLWNNDSAGELGQSLRGSAKATDWYKRSGVPVHGMSPMVKLLWLRDAKPELWAQTQSVAGIKEYLWHRWFGVWESDRSTASATGLMNLEKAVWDLVLLRAAGLEMHQLPHLVSTSHCRAFNVRIASRLGLEPGTPCFIGASDGALANLGSGAVDAGQAAVTIGTSAALRVVTHKPILDKSMRTFCYRVDEHRFIAGGASNNGGNAMAWFHEKILNGQVSLDELTREAAKISPGSEGLLFAPYLEGERAPVWDAGARASWTGLSAAHGRGHFTRSIMEGVMFNLKLIAESIENQMEIDVLYAGGGFINNKLWVRMLADILDKPVILPTQNIDASIYGAVMLARNSLGLNAMQDLKTKQLLPNKARAMQYRFFFERFKAAKF